MKPQTLLVLGLALVCGLSAAFGVQKLASNNASAKPAEPKNFVVEAKTTIQRGQKLTEEMVRLEPVTEDESSEGALSSKEEALDRMARNTISRGEVIQDGALAPAGESALSALIPEGMRAVTIQTPNEASSVASLISPKDRVDILFIEKGRNVGDAKVLVQNLEVLAVDQSIGELEATGEKTHFQSVTLIVQPQDALLLAREKERGILQLAMRGKGDDLMMDQMALSEIAFELPQVKERIQKAEEEKREAQRKLQTELSRLSTQVAELQKANQELQKTPESKPEVQTLSARVIRGATISRAQIRQVPAPQSAN